MSRGPGRIERIIEAAFHAAPNETFMVQDLTPLVYPGINLPEKRHRVAILRAASSVCGRVGWRARPSEHQKGALIYFNPISVPSHALAFIQAHNYGDRTDARMRLAKQEAEMQPGGVYFLHVEMFKAEQAGDQAECERLERLLRERVSKRWRDS